MRLPSLNALRAFEATARLGSLSKAAEELFVTPGAVSHQIKALEEDLGTQLLQREGRAVRPSEAGEAGLPALRRGFEALAEGSAAIRRHTEQAGSTLTVSAAPSFVSSWLIPRLDRFWARHPEVDIRIDTKWTLTDFARDEVDLAIRFGSGGYEGLYECPLFPEEVFPVCSPRLATPEKPLDTPADLRHHVLLHIDGHTTFSEWPCWTMWLKAAGVEDQVDAKRGSRFYISDFAYQAAMRGNGVTLGSMPLVQNHLEEGRLIRPFDLSVAPPLGYHVVCPEAHAQGPLVRTFIDWLLAEAEASCECLSPAA